MINQKRGSSSATDISIWSRRLTRSGRILIRDFLEPTVASAIYECLKNDTPWELVYQKEKENKVLTSQQLEKLTEDELRNLHFRIINQAKKDYQFCFERYPMLNAYLQGDQSVPLLNEILERANSSDFLHYCHQLTGDSQIRKIELQATRYSAGSFLKEHDDHANISDDRRYACIFGLTEQWPSDWGGVLQFTEQGKVTETFHPLFNSFAVFKVPQTHQVSFVAPYATGARYALTGWMRAD